MTTAGFRRGRCLWCILLFLTTAGLARAEDLTYLTRLKLPVVEDDIGYPRAVTADLHAGEVFVCDTRRNRIVIFDGEGLFRYRIPGGTVFSAPVDLAVDAEGYLFVLANHERRRTVLELDFDGRFLREVVLSGGPDTGITPSFSSIALSPSGDRLYALDTANRTLWVTDRDGRASTVVDLTFDLPERGKRNLILGKVDVYGDRVLVAVPMLGQIHVFDLDGTLLHQTGIRGTSACRLGFPTAAALDAEGNLVIVDQQRMYLVKWSIEEKRCISDHFGPGSAPGYLYFPLDLALDGSGRVYISQGYQGKVQAFKGLEPAAQSEAFPVTGNQGASARQAFSVETETPADRSNAPDHSASIEVVTTIRAWAEARSERRVEDYLSFYSADFIPSGTADRATWETRLRARTAEDGWSDIELTGLAIEFTGADAARARLSEALPAAPEGTSVEKTLLLERERGAWKIVREATD